MNQKQSLYIETTIDAHDLHTPRMETPDAIVNKYKEVDIDGEQLIKAIKAGFGYEHLKKNGQYLNTKELIEVILCYFDAIDETQDKNLEVKLNSSVAKALSDWWGYNISY